MAPIPFRRSCVSHADRQAELPAHPPCVQRSPGGRQPGGDSCEQDLLNCAYQQHVLLCLGLCTALFLQQSCILAQLPCTAACQALTVFICLSQVNARHTPCKFGWKLCLSTEEELFRWGGEEDDSMSRHQHHTWVIQEQLHTQQVQRTEMGHAQVFEDHTCLLSSGIASHSGQQDTCQPAFYPAKLAHLLQTPLCGWFPEISLAVLQGPRQR